MALRGDALARKGWVPMAFARPRRFFSGKFPVPRPGVCKRSSGRPRLERACDIAGPTASGKR
eukprot:5992739-Prorocentrum_lima.AAC.1